MKEYLDQPEFKFSNKNKKEIEDVEYAMIEKDKIFKKIEDLKFDIEDLKLNLELLNTLIIKFELKKELLLSDNFMPETMLYKELFEVDKSINDLQGVVLKNKNKINELFIKLGLELVNKEKQIRRQIEQN